MCCTSKKGVIMLEKEYKYYLDNKKEFVKKYLDKHIVIKGDSIIGVYNSLEEAVETSLKGNELGTFLVKQVEKEEQALRFYRRVFA